MGDRLHGPPLGETWDATNIYWVSTVQQEMFSALAVGVQCWTKQSPCSYGAYVFVGNGIIKQDANKRKKNLSDRMSVLKTIQHRGVLARGWGTAALGQPESCSEGVISDLRWEWWEGASQVKNRRKSLLAEGTATAKCQRHDWIWGVWRTRWRVQKGETRSGREVGDSCCEACRSWKGVWLVFWLEWDDTGDF